MAERWSSADGAFSWVIVPPLRDMQAALEELVFGKAHGAVGVLFHGLETDRSLGDPYFLPIYERAEELDLAICIHTGAGSRTMLDFQDSRYTRNFGQNRVLPLIGFHDLVFGNIPQRFPGLRFGFLEATASWVPFMLHFFRRSASRSGRDPAYFGPQLFNDSRIYVACESDEDIAYLAQNIGWDHILIGSDYGHTDQSLDLEIGQKLAVSEGVGSEEYRKILSMNPAAFYGLSSN
jgi:predicted TIM-barrel fold metal-dependent hydrolase